MADANGGRKRDIGMNGRLGVQDWLSGSGSRKALGEIRKAWLCGRLFIKLESLLLSNGVG